jgi:hypothetical protein
MVLIALVLAASQPQDAVVLTRESQLKELCQALAAQPAEADLDPAERVAAGKTALARRDAALSRWYEVEIPAKGFALGRYRAQEQQLELDGDRPVRALDDMLSLDLEGIDDVAFNARPEQVSAWSREKKAGTLRLRVVWSPAAERCAGSAAAEAWRIAARVRSWQLIGAEGVVAAANEDGEPAGAGPQKARVQQVTLDSDAAPQEDEGRERLSAAQRALDRCAATAQRAGNLMVSFSIQGGRVREPKIIMDSVRDEKASGCVAHAIAGAEVGGSGSGTASIAFE